MAAACLAPTVEAINDDWWQQMADRESNIALGRSRPRWQAGIVLGEQNLGAGRQGLEDLLHRAKNKGTKLSTTVIKPVDHKTQLQCTYCAK